jgi:hypothetical protein
MDMKNFTIETEPKIETGFKIPENYFDDFSERLFEKLPKSEPKVISIFAKRKTWMYAAAAVLVLGISIPVSNYFLKSNEIDELSMENYMVGNSNITDTDLANLLDEEDLKNINLELKTDDESIENELIKNQNIEQYLTE